MASQNDQDWQLSKKTVLERNCHMFNNPLMSDITFTCGESKRKYFYAHKYVLATSSPVFYAMFYGDLAEKNSVIHLEDADEESFEEFLRFLYTDECTLTPEVAVRVMYLAKKYIVPCLEEKSCFSILQNGLNPENVFTILDQVVQFDEEELQKKCWEVICSQTHEAVTSDNFNNVSKQTVNNLLKQDTLNIKEVELFNAVLKWSEHECSRNGLEATDENNRAILDEAVYQIRFLSMTQEEFAQNVSSAGVLTSEEVVSIYDKFSGKEGPLFKWKLPKRKLYLHRCSRFTRVREPLNLFGRPGSIYGRLWNDLLYGRDHRLGFQVSESVMFHGVRLLGCEDEAREFKVRFKVKEVEVCGTYYSEKDVNGLSGFDVMLPAPIVIDRNEVVGVVACILDRPIGSVHGCDGKTSVTVDEVTVTFSNVHDRVQEQNCNRTNTDSGQFHQIIFTKL